MMKLKFILGSLLGAAFLSSCSEYTYLYKSNNYRYKYEVAKAYFALGSYTKACTLIEDVLMQLKGTAQADESLFLLGEGYLKRGDYDLAATYFKQYYVSYPHGKLAELARYKTGTALYLNTPDPRLDQTDSYTAIQELQIYIEYYPDGKYRKQAEEMIYALQDKLAEKELESTKLYYHLGTYLGNNYQSCVVTAQNALRDYPYSKLREDFYIYILRAKYKVAQESVLERQQERYRDAVDEYYTFKNEFPESKYLKEAEKIFQDASQKIK
jgi:outer membrane protein assembly factor BamD